MKRFHFRLESVRALREQKERQALEVYAKAVGVVQAAGKRLQRLMENLEECRGLWRGQLAAGGAGFGLSQTRAYISILEEGQAKLEAELRAAQTQLEKARQALVAATRPREALDHYRQRLQRAHLQDEAKAEQKIFDEMGGRIVGRARAQLSQSSTRTLIA